MIITVFSPPSHGVSYITTFTVAAGSFFMILFYRFSQKNPEKIFLMHVIVPSKFNRLYMSLSVMFQQFI